MASFRDTLSKLFTRNVIVKVLPGGRLKAFDVNKSQSTGSPTEYGNRPKWKNGRGFNPVTGYGTGFSNVEIEAMRRQMYLDYELMDTDAIISSALDVISDESTTLSTENQLLVIKTDNHEIKKILHNLFYDVLNIEFNLWSWIRTMCKYGDHFLYLQIQPEFGVINVIPIHPSLMQREEGTRDNPDQVRFKYEGDITSYHSTGTFFEEYEIAHFRLLTDVNFLPYGRSAIEPAKKAFKMATMMEDAMLLHRIMRSPERRIFKIDVGNIAPNEIDGYIEQVANEMKKTPYIDPVTGDLNLKFNLQNGLEDYFLPVRGGNTGTSIETLPGLSNEGQLEDVKYMQNKILAALKIPKAFLGFSSDDGGDSKNSLASLDIRFARTIERVQKIFVSELYKIAIVHLRMQGYNLTDLMEFELNLTNPSLIFERQKTDILTAKVVLAKSMQEEGNMWFSDQYIYENVFGLAPDEWKADKDRQIEDMKFKFRLKQILEEGNDPELTGKSFGTPHDIASMQVASKFMPGENQESLKHLYTPDERENNPGKPDQHKSSFETKRDQDFGRDPVGRREMEKTESIKKIIRNLPDIQKNVKGSLKESVKINSIKFLDESQLIDDEIEDEVG